MRLRICCLGAAATLAVSVVRHQPAAAQAPERPAAAKDQSLPPPRPLPGEASLLPAQFSPIDLVAALRLAGVENPDVRLARERVLEAVARRQLAAVQFLPTINLGTNLDMHNGPLQRSTGDILKINRDSLYLGLGANAVGTGTVTIPGIFITGNVSQGIYSTLVARQVVAQREFESEAVRNDVLLRTAQAYLDLLQASARRAVAVQIRADAREVARVTANFAKTGQGRQADADRAATEYEQRQADVVDAENDLLLASARLAQILRLDPAVRLYPAESYAVPQSIVPDPVPLPELIAIALVQRPELKERRAAVRAALLRLRAAKVLPFSPNVLLGYSTGTFGGGSNLVPTQSRFGNFDGRQDFDAVLWWSLRNLGLGNVALTRLADSNLRQDRLRELATLDRVRAEVAAAYARTHARFAQIEPNERAIRSSREAFAEDLRRTRNQLGLPIEVLDSLRLLARSRYAYLDAIIDYNRAQFELFVALGQPPADTLARPVPPELLPPAADAAKE
jgi:outer membrane protein TolC